ncbi:MAG: methyltransferase domain-containing protein [Gammaproteobacteria bacterium]|nr:methyltransferase domain-containing protein [Gammaproteobacteria bacterium]MDE0247360.1 methyltransferase domain-containing protein [Gammaproteobacteria bacterium]
MSGGHDLEAGSGTRGYDSASLQYREAAQRYWKFLSLRTVEQLELGAGGSVLDIACGPGVSTAAAAAAVGPGGRVAALDSSAEMLRMTLERAVTLGIGNVKAVLGDMAHADFPAASFDAVISVLGVFYVPDMPALVSRLWQLVRPGGRLAITTLGEGAFQPAFGIWKEAVRAERPDARLTFSWERTDNPGYVRALLREAGVPSPEVRLEPRELAISGAEDWWLAVMGSGMRRIALELDDDTGDRVRADFDRRLREARVRAIQMPGIYATAKKPVLGGSG